MATVRLASAAAGFFRLSLCALVLVVLLAPALPASDSEPDDGVLDTVATAPVVIDGVALFRLRGTSSYPASERATDVRTRIVAVARDRTVDPAAIRVEPSEIGQRLTYGDGSANLVTVTEADATLEGVGEEILAAALLRNVRQAITTYRQMREPERLLRSAGWALGVTGMLIGLLLAGRSLFRRVDATISRRIEAGVEKLRIQTYRLMSAEETLVLLRAVLRGLRAGSLLVLLYAYLKIALSLFPWTRGFAAGMLDLVLEPLTMLGRAALATVPDLAFLAVLTVVTRLVLRLTRLIFLQIDRGVVKFEHFDPDWAMPTYRLFRIVVIAFAVVVAFPYIPGSSSTAFKGVSLFAGVLFSLGSSSIIGNIIAGYTMTYRRAFRDGDWIRVGDVLGEVTQTRLLVTNLRNPQNEEVVVPNSIILGSNVVNYSSLARSKGLILHSSVGIGYETPWRQVEAMLLLAAERTQGLRREPAPFVHQTALGDFAITYQLNAYCDAPQQMRQLYTELHRQILDVFNEYGIQIMTPAYERDTPEPKLVPRDRWFAAPAQPPTSPG